MRRSYALPLSSVTCRASLCDARRLSTRPAGVAAELGARAHLDLEVGGRELYLRAALAHQHIGKDRQRVAPLDDAGDLLQRLEKLRICRFDFQHGLSLSICSFK